MLFEEKPKVKTGFTYPVIFFFYQKLLNWIFTNNSMLEMNNHREQVEN